MTSALLCDFTQRRMVVSYWRFGTTYRSHLRGLSNPRRMPEHLGTPCSRYSPWNALPSKMGPIGCPETSVRNYHFRLRKIPKERRSHLNYTYILLYPRWGLCLDFWRFQSQYIFLFSYYFTLTFQVFIITPSINSVLPPNVFWVH